MHVQLAAEEKGEMETFMEMQHIIIHAQYDSISRGYLQYSGVAWSGTESIPHHTYLIPQEHRILDGVHLLMSGVSGILLT